MYPIGATGWNHDIIYGGGELGTGISGSMDNGGGFYGGNWYGIGRNTDPGAELTGLPIDITASLSTPEDLFFLLQPHAGASNSLLLSGGQSGGLSFTEPSPYVRLSLIGATGNGTANTEITVYYANGTTEIFGGGAINQDWFFNETGVAFIANGRTSNNEGTMFDNVNNNQPRLYQEVFELSNITSEVLSISVVNNGSGHNAILAISGEAIPEPTSAGLLATGIGMLTLRRNRKRQIVR